MLARLAFALLIAAAGPAAALQITLHFSLEDVSGARHEYVVNATGDVPWSALAFGLDASVLHSYSSNRENFEGLVHNVSTTGDVFYQQDTLRIDGWVPAGSTINMGTLSTELALAPGAYWLTSPPDPEAPGDVITWEAWELAFTTASEIRAAGETQVGGAPVFVLVNPEPGTVALLGLSLLALLGLRCRV